MNRERLPNRRAGEIMTFDHEGVKCTAQIGRYIDGRLAEIFLDTNKRGSAVDVAAKDLATVASIALQYGVPASVLRDALSQDEKGNMRGPLGIVLQMAEGNGQ